MRQTRKVPLERRRSYARRRKTSTCRGISHSKCSFNSKTCTYASGALRRFCRRKNNTPHSLSVRKVRKKYTINPMYTQTRKSQRLANRPRKDFSIYR